MKGRNGSWRLTGLWKTVRGASNPITVDNIATEADDRRNIQPQDEGDGSQPGTGRMTAQRTIRPLLSPKSKCRIGTWNVTRTALKSEVGQLGETARNTDDRGRNETKNTTWKELEKTATDKE